MRMQWETNRNRESTFWVREGQSDVFFCRLERHKTETVIVDEKLVMRDLMTAAITFPGTKK